MRVRALRVWNDLLEGVQRHEGDEFEVTGERYAEIYAYRADLVAPVDAKPSDDAKPAPAKRGTRRTTRKTAGK